MSGTPGHYRQITGTEARRRLAELMSQELGVSLSPEQIRVMIARQWSKLQLLAHAAHDDYEPATDTSTNAARAATNDGRQPQ
jgi:hypothetical protein